MAFILVSHRARHSELPRVGAPSCFFTFISISETRMHCKPGQGTAWKTCPQHGGSAEKHKPAWPFGSRGQEGRGSGAEDWKVTAESPPGLLGGSQPPCNRTIPLSGTGAQPQSRGCLSDAGGGALQKEMTVALTSWGSLKTTQKMKS